MSHDTMPLQDVLPPSPPPLPTRTVLVWHRM